MQMPFFFMRAAQTSLLSPGFKYATAYLQSQYRWFIELELSKTKTKSLIFPHKSPLQTSVSIVLARKPGIILYISLFPTSHISSTQPQSTLPLKYILQSSLVLLLQATFISCQDYNNCFLNLLPLFILDPFLPFSSQLPQLSFF